MNDSVKKGLALVGVITLGATGALAEGVLTAPTFDIADFSAIAGALLIGLAAIWSIKKGLSLVR